MAVKFSIRIAVAILAVSLPRPLLAGEPADGKKDLAHEIFDAMSRLPGHTPGSRPVHAKGLVCQGRFAPTAEAQALTKAVHFQPGSPVTVTVRFSQGSPDAAIPDNAPNAGPRGMAIRFVTADGREMDIVAMSHNGFVVGTGQDFLELQRAVVA